MTGHHRSGRNYVNDRPWLLLFDVDGTLLEANGAGKATIVYALAAVFGTSGPSDDYRLAGKTDKRILMDLLNAAGIDASQVESRLPEVYALMADRARQTFPTANLVSLPGVVELLNRLRDDPRVLLGLLTGNISLTVPLKLRAAGLHLADFPVAAYGSESLDRNHLPAIAWRRAGQLTGHAFDGSNTVVIGDTPADIVCASANGARSLAVATGQYSTQALAEYHPDLLVTSLAETESVLEFLLSGESNGR